MTYREMLSQHVIAISTSDSPDMPVLGLSQQHLYDAMTEIARHLLALGARIVYGGDLRAKEGANKQVISSQADSLIKISRIWADFFPANTSNQPI